MSKLKLTETQRKLLELADNQMGRCGWPLSTWQAWVKPACEPLFAAGLLKERRLGGYPGVEITDAGRAALASS